MDIQEIFSPDTSNKLTSAIRDLDEVQEKSRKLSVLIENVIKLYSGNFGSKQFLQDPDLVAAEKSALDVVVSFKEFLQLLQTELVELIKKNKESLRQFIQVVEILTPISDQLSENTDLIRKVNKQWEAEVGFIFDDVAQLLERNHELMTLYPRAFERLKAYAIFEYRFGKVYIAKGNWYQGLKHLEISLAIQREFDDFNARAATVYEIGRVHQLLDNSDEARMRYRDALRLYQHVGNLKGVMACKLALGNIAAQQGFVEEGVKLLQETKQFYMAHNQEELTQNVESVLQFLNQVKEKQPA